MVSRGNVRKLIHTIIYSVLIVVYCFFYMEEAVSNYTKKQTTIVQGKEDIDEIKSPVFVICPDPPYKPSFFRGNGRNDTEAADKFFWALPYYSDWFDENTFIAKDFYEKMTYQLESDLLLYMQVYNEK